MIKLKKLVLESWASWKSPADAPDDVIEIYHKIVANLLQQKENPHEWVKLMKVKNVYFKDDEPYQIDGWSINHKNKRTYLYYDPDNDSAPWKFVGGDSEKSGLEDVIKDWTKY